VPEHRAGQFSFAAFNRDYLQRHEGCSMLVLDTADARADIETWRAAGLQTYAPFDFSRAAKMADGRDITVSFSLAFVSHPAPHTPLVDGLVRLPASHSALFQTAALSAACQRRDAD